jgi:hypothetical protein
MTRLEFRRMKFRFELMKGSSNEGDIRSLH